MINAVTSGDLGTEYNIYQHPSQASDTSSLTKNSDRDKQLPPIVLQSPPRNCFVRTTLLRLLGANRLNGMAGIIGLASKMRVRILVSTLSGRQRTNMSS